MLILDFQLLSKGCQATDLMKTEKHQTIWAGKESNLITTSITCTQRSMNWMQFML